VAVELRHRSWFSDEVQELLTRHRAALCLTDKRNRRSPIWRTADWTYLRLHQGRATPPPCYGRAALAGWAERLAETWPEPADRFVFFNNDPLGCAVRDGAVAGRVFARRGLVPTRTPEARSVMVG
jgi:uncharacterized protein YecE (DUF72 family)